MQNDAIKKTKWARKYFITLGVVILCGLGGVLLITLYNSKTTCPFNNATILQRPKNTLLIGLQTVQIEHAITESQRSHGLCCRDYLAPTAGMLFIYDKPGNYRFWMKDTRIPLDIYWISAEKKIVHIEKNVQPSSYPESFGTDTPAQYVLETNAGFAKKHDVKIGDSVDF